MGWRPDRRGSWSDRTATSLKLQLPMAMNLRHEAHHHRAEEGIRRHRAIVAALATNDPVTAMAALDDHGEKLYLSLDPEPGRDR